LAAEITAALAAADIACVLLRFDPALSDRDALAAARRLGPPVQKAGAAFLVANRVEIAAEAGADGVHLDDAAEFDAARRRLGKDASIGVGSADPDDAMTVAEAGADYVAFGRFDDPAPVEPAIELLAWWAPVMTVPCVIAGAVDAASAKRLANLGADFVAVSLAGPDGARLPEIATALGGG